MCGSVVFFSFELLITLVSFHVFGRCEEAGESRKKKHTHTLREHVKLRTGISGAVTLQCATQIQQILLLCSSVSPSS